ncbi:MAG: hypothetical protein ABT940_05615 [Alphaproteobacteria bacterium]
MASSRSGSLLQGLLLPALLAAVVAAPQGVGAQTVKPRSSGASGLEVRSDAASGQPVVGHTAGGKTGGASGGYAPAASGGGGVAAFQRADGIGSSGGVTIDGNTTANANADRLNTQSTGQGNKGCTAVGSISGAGC